MMNRWNAGDRPGQPWVTMNGKVTYRDVFPDHVHEITWCWNVYGVPRRQLPSQCPQR
jgi:hypothetical protein